jgi:hypothetical protein
MDTALSVGLQHASFKFTMCRSCHISYSQRMPLLHFWAKFPGKTTGVPVKTARLGISRFLQAGRFFAYLPVTGNYISELILKSSAWQRCGYTGPLCFWGIWIRRHGPPGSESLESKTLKYSHEYRGIRTREWLRWRGPAAIVNDRPVSSQRGRRTSANSQLSDSNKNVVLGPRLVLDTKRDWPTDRRS